MTLAVGSLPLPGAALGVGSTAGPSSGAVPSYSVFRKHAAFVPELADFALTERQLGRLLAEYGLDAAAGTGLGDVRILFQQLQRSGCLTYSGLSQLYSVLSARKQRLQQRLDEARTAALQSRQREEAERRMWEEELGAGSDGESSGGAGLGTSALLAVHRGVPRAWGAGAPRPPHLLVQDGGAHGGAHGPASAEAHAGGGLPHRASHLTPASASHPHHSAEPMSAYERFLDLLKPLAPAAATSPRPFTAPATSSPHGCARGRGAEGGEAGPSGGALGGTATLMTQQQPPVLLRETFPAPPCEFAPIRTQLRGVREMMSGADARACLNALKDIYKDWEMALEEKQAKEELKRSRRKSAAPSSGPAPSAAAAAAAGKVPPEGSAFLLLAAACCCLTLQQYDVARKILSASESQFPTGVLGIEHPYYYTIFFCQGIVNFHDDRFEDAIQKFEAARDLADLVGRSKRDPTACKNVGCCLNNIGVCSHMLGRRSEAVASFREAVKALQGACGPNATAAQAAAANLARAVRISFAMTLRPRSAGGIGGPHGSLSAGGVFARPMSASVGGSRGAMASSGSLVGVSGLPVTASAAGGKLQAFLRQAVTNPPTGPVMAIPKWATRSDGEEAMRKAQAKAKGKGKEPKKESKDGKKAPKKKKAVGFQIAYPLAYYDPPTFGVANVSLAAKKKAKKKAAAK